MEHRKKCNVCGTVFCYTDEDIKNNSKAHLWAGISALGAAASALGGNWGATRTNQENAFNEERKVIDFDHCPNCRSIDLSILTDVEWNDYQEGLKNQRSGGISINANASEESLVKRIKMFIDDGQWQEALSYSEHVLDMNPENGEVYFLRIMANNRIKKVSEFIDKKINIRGDNNFAKASKFGDEEIQKKIEEIDKGIQEQRERDQRRKAAAEQKIIDNSAIESIRSANNSEDIEAIWADLDALKKLVGRTSFGLSEDIEKIEQRIKDIRESRIANKKRKIKKAIIAVCAIAVIIIVIAIISWIAKNVKKQKIYDQAYQAEEAGDIVEALSEYREIRGYKDVDDKIQKLAELKGRRDDFEVFCYKETQFVNDGIPSTWAKTKNPEIDLESRSVTIQTELSEGVYELLLDGNSAIQKNLLTKLKEKLDVVTSDIYEKAKGAYDEMDVYGHIYVSGQEAPIYTVHNGGVTEDRLLFDVADIPDEADGSPDFSIEQESGSIVTYGKCSNYNVFHPRTFSDEPIQKTDEIPWIILKIQGNQAFLLSKYC